MADKRNGAFRSVKQQPLPGSVRSLSGAQSSPLFASPNSMSRKEKRGKQSAAQDFADFEHKTSDAWDDGEDDIMISMGNLQIPLKDIQSTAQLVLQQHREQRQKTARPETSAASGRGDHNIVSPDVVQHQLEQTNGAAAPSPARPLPEHPPGKLIRLKARPHRRVQTTEVAARDKEKVAKYQKQLSAPAANMDEMRKLSWSGVPDEMRPVAWKVLAGYVPNHLERRAPTLTRKRAEYMGFVSRYFDLRDEEEYTHIFKQIQKDIPRMDTIAQHKSLQDMFERVLYIWSIRHPASGYVQGMNDLLTPFAYVFLLEYIPVDLDELDSVALEKLTEAELHDLEADCFWCLTRLLDGIQDNYTFSQPGIQKKVYALKELIKRIDGSLYQHLEQNQVEFLQFAFRWMNNLLTRELPLRCVVRLWDTYLSEPAGFAEFHLYVCASLLGRFSHDLRREHDFQGLMLLLQRLPTHCWGDEEINELLAEAFSLKELFAQSPKHLVQRQQLSNPN